MFTCPDIIWLVLNYFRKLYCLEKEWAILLAIGEDLPEKLLRERLKKSARHIIKKKLLVKLTITQYIWNG